MTPPGRTGFTLDQINQFNGAAGLAAWTVEEWQADPGACLRITRRRVRQAARREWARGNNTVESGQRPFAVVDKHGRTSKSLKSPHPYTY